MRIIVTGASGFVGRELVPLLADAGGKLLLVGRNTEVLEHLFPDQAVCDYASLAQEAKGFDMLVHLAVANSDSAASLATYRDVNVDFTCKVAQMAREAGVACFVHVSSSHALDGQNQSGYAVSKREAAERLKSVAGLQVINVYLPLVYGREWSGRLAWLNRLPNGPANRLFRAFAALKPTVNIERFAEFLIKMLPALEATEREVILSDPQGKNPFFSVPKRLIDIGFALSVTLFLCWLLILIWIAIRAQSRGPGIIAQTRVGRNGVEFTCYKFRTMLVGTIQAGTHEVSDAAVTALGRFLRRTKLDELPQIINIMCNEVSLIGPRPCLPMQIELIEARRRCGVLDIKPGITGLAQINGIDMSDPHRLAVWDFRYMRLQSLLLDIRILMSTLAGKGRGDRVSSV
ncbi:sugar transferase [Hoeflea sp.]|uniref:sugar transferase n=1 Tax=Hoeflea sp. TaxID=1940281 RepID=UPI003A8E96DC